MNFASYQVVLRLAFTTHL